jgi:formylmethanofuran dehydrogenase subunit E
MKITERIEKIEGIDECWYDYDSKTLSCILGKCDEESVKLKVIATIRDENLLDSITKFNFYTYVHVKTKWGFRKKHTTSGLFVCSNCDELLNQEDRVPYDGLCPCCRMEVNLDKMFPEGIKRRLA